MWKDKNSKTVPNQWHALDLIWFGGEEIVKAGLPHSQLSPVWQMVLLGDGSPTRNFQILTGESTEVDVIDMSKIGEEDDGAPTDVRIIAEPRIRRQVWLRTASGQKLLYAASWWNADLVDEYLQNRSLPIGKSLSRSHTELYQDIKKIYYGNSTDLEGAFGETGPFWGRHYIFWHDRKPLTLIYEVFSPCLKKYLGETI
ncbi:MAG: chorismate lyase [Xenococcaceae cyanobacterium]